MKIENKAALRLAILELEQKKIVQEEELIAQFKATKESLSPINLIKEGFNKLTDMPSMGGGLVKTLAGLGVGIISKKLFLGKSSSLVKKLLAGVFEFAVAKTTINNADKVKAFGVSLYHNLFKKNTNQNHTE